MTSIQKVESLRATQAQRLLMAALLCLLALGLSGCGGGAFSNMGSLFDRSTSSAPPPPIALAPIIGPPAKVSKDLTNQISAVAKEQNISVVPSSEAVYTVRGYLTASPEGKNQKLAYIWDVTEKSGKRVHRVVGEQIVPGRPGAQAWSLVDQKTLNAIATKTMADLGTWLPKQKVAPAATPATRQVAAASQRATPSSVPAKPGEFFVMVPPVEGAPGDGKKSLTEAMKKQLVKRGVKFSNYKRSNAYTVAGKVTLDQVSSDKQKITILWYVSDPNGKKIGKVSNGNTIPRGALDAEWGPQADAAVVAVADNILKYLPAVKN